MLDIQNALLYPACMSDQKLTLTLTVHSVAQARVLELWIRTVEILLRARGPRTDIGYAMRAACMIVDEKSDEVA